jgi:uncharacterized protein YdeI (YjbR/CyaY-like superfamily)
MALASYRNNMGIVDDAPRQHIETREQWRAWLEAHHSEASGVFVVSWRPATGRLAVPYASLVEEALCFGWVDSRQVRLDEERTMLWFTPRRVGSGWARLNKERISRLITDGRMHPAGLAVIDAARADGSWELLDSVENLEVPKDLMDAFALRPGARENFASFSRSVRRGILQWIATAKTPQTRARRVTETAERAAVGEKANQPRG